MSNSLARTLRRYHWPARGVTPPAARTPPLDLAEAKLASGLPELSGSISASTLWSLYPPPRGFDECRCKPCGLCCIPRSGEPPDGGLPRSRSSCANRARRDFTRRTTACSRRRLAALRCLHRFRQPIARISVSILYKMVPTVRYASSSPNASTLRQARKNDVLSCCFCNTSQCYAVEQPTTYTPMAYSRVLSRWTNVARNTQLLTSQHATS